MPLYTSDGELEVALTVSGNKALVPSVDEPEQ